MFVGIDLSDATSQQYADRASAYLTASSIAINLDATDIPGDQPVLMQ
ncbi:hypothetical protein [Enteractinococcus helveticum]|nr:hypothetical protein [Enteractinococcus helveticum]